MSENYQKTIKNMIVGDDCVVRFEDASGFEPYSILDEHKTKKSGFFKNRHLTKADRDRFFEQSGGILFACPVCNFFSGYASVSASDQMFLQGLDGLILARVFDSSMKNQKVKNATYRDCVLSEDGTVILVGDSCSVKNEASEVMQDFNYGINPRHEYAFSKKGHWEIGRARYGSYYLSAVYAQIAQTVAKKSVEECGVQRGVEEFATAKSLPAKIFKADPKFVENVLSGVETVLTNKLRRVKQDDATQIASVVSTGERIAKQLKQIFKDKMEEAKDVKFTVFCSEPKKLFKEGTFSADFCQQAPEASNTKDEEKNK